MDHKIAHVLEDLVIAQSQARGLQPLAGGVRAAVNGSARVAVADCQRHLSGVAFHQDHLVDHRQRVALHLGNARAERCAVEIHSDDQRAHAVIHHRLDIAAAKRGVDAANERFDRGVEFLPPELEGHGGFRLFHKGIINPAALGAAVTPAAPLRSAFSPFP